MQLTGSLNVTGVSLADRAARNGVLGRSDVAVPVASVTATVGAGPVRMDDSGVGSGVGLWRNRDFMLLWTGGTLSAIGSSMSMFLFPILGYAVTGSTTQAALAGTCYLVGSVTIQLPAGALVDRWSRRRVMVISSGMGAILYTVLAITLVADVVTLPVILGVAALTGVVSVVFGPAETAAVRQVVPSHQLPTALSQNQARQFAASLVGPPLGGALYAIKAWVPFLTDALSYAIAALTTSAIRHPLGRPDRVETQPTTIRADIVEGLRFLLSRGVFRAIVASAVLINFAAVAMFLVLALKLFRAGVAPAAIGSIEAIAAVAGIGGAIAAPWLIRRVPTGRIVLLACVLIPLAVAPMALTNNVAVLGGLLAAAFVGLPSVNAAIDSYLIAVTPDRLQGRVDSGLGFATSVLQPAGPLVGGFLLAQIGGKAAMLATAGLMAAGVLVLAASTEVRRLPTPDRWDATDQAEIG